MKVACFSILAFLAGSGIEVAAQEDTKANVRKGGFTLQILHSSDNESNFQDLNTLEDKILNYAAIAEHLKRLGEMEKAYTLHLTAGDHTLPGPYYKASAEVPYLGKPGLGDIIMYNAMGLEANGMGNHEFDGGINQFADMLATAFYPFIAANLDFSKAVTTVTSIKIAQDAGPCSAARGAVTKSCFIRLDNKVVVGLIGRAPADFFNVIADPKNTIPGIDFVGGRDPVTNQPLVSAVGQVLEQVDLLERRGANVIILVDHAQDFTLDPLSAASLRGIDIIVQAGSTGFVGQSTPTGPFNFLRDGDVPTAPYPVVRTDKEGRTVLAVNSDQLYRYIGHLLVRFDKNGNLVSWDSRSGPIATTAEAVGLLSNVVKGKKSSLSKRKRQKTVPQVYADLKATPLITAAFTVVGTTSEELNGLRADVRTKETNLGRLAAESSIWAAQEYVDANGPAGVTVQMALKNGGGIRGTIEGPQITVLVIEGALAFDNKLTVVRLTATQLLAALENAFSRFPSADGRFAQLAGLRVTFDPSKPGLQAQTTVSTPSRVIEMAQVDSDGIVVDTIVSSGTLQGDPARTFVLATNNFLTTGGDGYAAFAAATQLATTTLGEQQILEDYISSELGGIVDIPDPPTPANVINAAV
ncbi:hypothetical protein MHU86_2091 [Fragilaria crotonensis]|nr:hypothetical protein MHU86_2091 [Fragilaria crotonensis]